MESYKRAFSCHEGLAVYGIAKPCLRQRRWPFDLWSSVWLVSRKSTHPFSGTVLSYGSPTRLNTIPPPPSLEYG
jgi:hypothetical protein